MSAKLDGQVALITGAAGGQGAATARRFVAEGAQVLLTDINDERGEKLAEELRAQGSSAIYRHHDVSTEDGWSEVVDTVQAEFGGLDVLVNNAGILTFAPLGEMSLQQYQELIGINQIGTFLGMRSAVAPMTDRGGGSIINVSSVEGIAGMPYLSAYCGSKFAIRGMTKSAAMELGEKGIRVNSVHPGMIDTEMIRGPAGGADVDLSPVTRRLALDRTGEPEEIAGLTVFLASADSSYCTGGEFVADGGASATHALHVR